MHYEQLLEDHGIKPTANRLLIARTLAGAFTPLSLSELAPSSVSTTWYTS